LCKIIQTLNGPKPDLLRLVGGGLQRSLGSVHFNRLQKLKTVVSQGCLGSQPDLAWLPLPVKSQYCL
jgi:hypothetical protein